jgi:hypothetical protein
MKEMKLLVPCGVFAMADDAAAKRLKEIAQRLKEGKDVAVTKTGEVVKSDDPKAGQENTMNVPTGKMA